MMKHLINILLFVLPVLGMAQTMETQFTVVAQFGAFSAVNDSTWRGNITMTADQLGEGYLATQITVGDYVVDLVNGILFEVTVVNVANFTTANVDIEELADNNQAPLGVGIVYRPDPRYPYKIPPVPENSAGISAAGLAKVLINNFNQVHDGVNIISSLSDTSTVTNPLPGDIVMTGTDTLAVYTGSAWQPYFGSAAGASTIFTGGTFSISSTLDLLENGSGGYSTRFRNGAGGYMSILSDTTDSDFLGLRWTTLRGGFDVGETLTGFRIKSQNDLYFTLSNTLKRYYYTYDAVPVNDTISYLAAIDPATGVLSKRAVSSIAGIYSGSGTVGREADLLALLRDSTFSIARTNMSGFEDYHNNGTGLDFFDGFYYSPNYWGGYGFYSGVADGSRRTYVHMYETSVNIGAYGNSGTAYSAEINLYGGGFGQGKMQIGGSTASGAYNYYMPYSQPSYTLGDTSLAFWVGGGGGYGNSSVGWIDIDVLRGSPDTLTITADAGTPGLVTGGDTLSIVGGTNITTSVSGGVVTINATGGGTVAVNQLAYGSAADTLTSSAAFQVNNIGVYRGVDLVDNSKLGIQLRTFSNNDSGGNAFNAVRYQDNDNDNADFYGDQMSSGDALLSLWVTVPVKDSAYMKGGASEIEVIKPLIVSADEAHTTGTLGTSTKLYVRPKNSLSTDMLMLDMDSNGDIIMPQLDGDSTATALVGVTANGTLTTNTTGLGGGSGSPDTLTITADAGTPGLVTGGDTLSIVGGTNITTSVSGGVVTINASGSATPGHVVADEGVAEVQRDTINFVGAAVDVTDDGTKTVVTITETAQTIDTFSISGDTISLSLSSDAQPAQNIITGFSRTVTGVTPATDSTITAIDLQSKYVGVFQIDCTTCSTTKTIVFSAPTNPVDGGVYTWHFQNTTATNSINLPATFLDETGTALDGGTTYDLTADKWFTCYYDGTNYYCK